MRSHHLRLYSNTHRKTYEVRSRGVSGKVCAGGDKGRFKLIYGVIALSELFLLYIEMVDTLCTTDYTTRTAVGSYYQGSTVMVVVFILI